MTDETLSLERWAFRLTHILNAACVEDRFPVDVKAVAKEISKQLFPDEPVSLIKGDSLPGFDGALYKAPPGKKGWGIFCNSDITSPGRINFTWAHEFGHYLLHRLKYPDGIECASRAAVVPRGMLLVFGLPKSAKSSSCIRISTTSPFPCCTSAMPWRASSRTKRSKKMFPIGTRSC